MILPPKEIGVKWSIRTLMPTVVLFFSKLPEIASSVASSIRATTLGVARTGTSPELKATERSLF